MNQALHNIHVRFAGHLVFLVARLLEIERAQRIVASPLRLVYLILPPLVVGVYGPICRNRIQANHIAERLEV